MHRVPRPFWKQVISGPLERKPMLRTSLCDWPVPERAREHVHGEYAVASADKLAPLLRLQGLRDAQTHLMPCQPHDRTARATEIHPPGAPSALGRSPVLAADYGEALGEPVGPNTLRHRSDVEGRARRVGCKRGRVQLTILRGPRKRGARGGCGPLGERRGRRGRASAHRAPRPRASSRRWRAGTSNSPSPISSRTRRLSQPSRQEPAELASEPQRRCAVEECGSEEGAGPGVPVARRLGS
jgi:hypothetical protein